VILEQETLTALIAAVKKLDDGFSRLPALEHESRGMERLAEVLGATAERLQDNYPYFLTGDSNKSAKSKEC
jgi:hypothetical protein